MMKPIHRSVGMKVLELGSSRSNSFTKHGPHKVITFKSRMRLNVVFLFIIIKFLH